MNSDHKFRHDVEAILERAPNVGASHIGVAVEGGVVTLSGHVTSWVEKWDAERVAKRVLGIKGLANEIEVNLPGSRQRSDTDIAKAAVHALQWNTALPEGNIRVTVKDACVTLEGSVEWAYQRRLAEDTVHYLTGVRRVTNQISIRAVAKPKEVKEAITKALESAARTDAEHIQVETQDHMVTLRGRVSSLAEKDEAEDAAWDVPGVCDVDNRIVVSY